MAIYNFKADDQLQDVIHRNSETIHAEPGVTLFREGEKVRGMYLIVSGKVDLQLHSAGMVTLVRHASPGCLLGVPASINQHPYSLTAQVRESAELRFVPIKVLSDLMKRETGLTLKLIAMLSEEVRSMRKAIANPERVTKAQPSIS